MHELQALAMWPVKGDNCVSSGLTETKTIVFGTNAKQDKMAGKLV